MKTRFILIPVWATLCFLTGFANQGYAQECQKPKCSEASQGQAPQLGLELAQVTPGQAPDFQERKENKMLESVEQQPREQEETELDKLRTAVKSLKQYNDALEARVKELEKQLADCEAQKGAPKSP
jgi:hypothetical protein